MTKICYDCKTLKPLTDFAKKRKNKDGLQSQCRVCAAAYRAEWGRRNPEKLLASNRAHYERNAESMRQKTRDWVAANKERKRDNDRKWRDKNLAAIARRSKVFRESNADRLLKKNRDYRAANRERLKEAQRAWRKANHGKVIANVTARKKRVRRATPPWLSRSQRKEIQQFYVNAAAANEALGANYQVDHIVPIVHDLVCGLHVPWNLQLLTAEENVEKSNRFDGWG
jgi:hypothetical protein